MTKTQTVYRLYVGSPTSSGKLSNACTSKITRMVGKHFESFTVVQASGCFRGKSEDSLIITIASKSSPPVRELARTLRQMLTQDGIGLESNGHYERITD